MSDVGRPSPLLLLVATPLPLPDRLAVRECIITLSRPRIVFVFPVPVRAWQGQSAHHSKDRQCVGRITTCLRWIEVRKHTSLI